MNEYRLIDLVKIKNGRDHKSLSDGTYPAYGSGGLMRMVDGYLYDKESILLPRKGTLNNIQYSDQPFWTVDTLYYTEINQKKVDAYYLYYYLKLLDLNPLYTGTGVPSMTFGAYYGIKIKLPRLDDQKKISTLLGAIDKKIELNNRINAELEAMAKTLYDYWFVQFDFPDANGKPYKTSGGKMVYNDMLKREIPEGWEDGIASDLFLFNPQTSLKKGEKATYIDMDALPTKGFMTKRPQLKEFNGGVKFVKNDVAFARITPCLENGKTALLSRLNETETGFGSTEFIILRGKTFPLPALSACLSRSDPFRKFAISNMTGTSGRKRIDSKVLETYSLPIPPENLIIDFEKALKPFFEKMTINSIENDNLAAYRDWLLPMLMNGQVTVTSSSKSNTTGA